MKRGLSHLEIPAATFSEDKEQPAVVVGFHLLSHAKVPRMLIPATFLSLNLWKIQFIHSFIRGMIVEADRHLKAQGQFGFFMI